MNTRLADGTWRSTVLPIAVERIIQVNLWFIQLPTLGYWFIRSFRSLRLLVFCSSAQPPEGFYLCSLSNRLTMLGPCSLRHHPKTCGQAKYGYHPLTIGWSLLQGALMSQLLPGTTRLGRSFLGFAESDDGVAVRFALHGGGEETWRARILLGCDGVRSTLRQQILADGPPRYTGFLTWQVGRRVEGLDLKNTGRKIQLRWR